MKATLVFCTCLLFLSTKLKAQVTQINNNNSLNFEVPISNTKQIFVSATDSTVWSTDGTLAGTIQLSATIKFVNGLGSLAFLNGTYIFAATTPALGIELYITNGTPGGTFLLKDINTGAVSSSPTLLGAGGGFLLFTAETASEGNELWRTDGTPGGTTLVKDINPGIPGSSVYTSDVASLGGFLYFTAQTAAEGRELWRTNGSTAGTTLVKDIVPGTGDSNYPDKYSLFSTNTYLLFNARTPASGVELWRSDGTTAGTVLLKDINAGVDSSDARSFFLFNSTVLFEATDATHGDEIWRTDGTPAGTDILKDINPGTDSSTKIFQEIIPGFGISWPVFNGFHVFNNHAYFTAYDGTSAGEVWSTDGTSANTVLVKDIVTNATPPLPFILLGDAINLPGKFIFPVADQTSGRSELWESDGTTVGTILFKTFSPATAGTPPFIFIPFSFTGSSFLNPLFQGDKFFFSAGMSAEGNELWISDGVDATAAHTHIVKDINPGTNDSDPGQGGYLYTTTELFFPATNAAVGLELWRSDGTTAGTNLVQDINLGIDGADPVLDFFILNGKILFEATDGDNATETDLFVVNGTFIPLPIKLTDFTVSLKGNDGLLQWKTLQEINSKDFTVQRSFDAQHFDNIGVINAAGNSSNAHAYSFIDAGIASSGKDIVYYRLATSDKDGKTQNTNIISLKLKGNSKWSVRLLSNPVKNNPVILLSGSTGLIQFSIRDISGKTVYTNSFQNVNGQISLPANLQKGMYILLAETNNERQAIKFVKQ
jgi:ELWxxDGT repeat protein